MSPNSKRNISSFGKLNSTCNLDGGLSTNTLSESNSMSKPASVSPMIVRRKRKRGPAVVIQGNGSEHSDSSSQLEAKPIDMELLKPLLEADEIIVINKELSNLDGGRSNNTLSDSNSMPKRASVSPMPVRRKRKRGPAAVSRGNGSEQSDSSSQLQAKPIDMELLKPPLEADEIIVINKESTLEAHIGLSAGFPADSLTDEEIEANVVSTIGGIEQVNYIIIRNHIIAKWRENISSWLEREQFIPVIPSNCHCLLNSAYDFLLTHGYINFGVAPAIKQRAPKEADKPLLVIIGAGLAGLAAARQLMGWGFKIVVLEGRRRAGGRVYTKKMEGLNQVASADLGGSVLTSTLGNPLGILAKQLNYSLYKVRVKCPLYQPNGFPVESTIDAKVERTFNRILDKASRLRHMMGGIASDVSLGAALETFRQVYGDTVNADEMHLFNWHLANLEYANAGLLSKLSLAFWDQDDPYEMGGEHCFVPGGNRRLISALAEKVPIHYEKTVQGIHYGSDGVLVYAGG